MTIKDKFLKDHPECKDFTKVFLEFCPNHVYKYYENESTSCPTDECGNCMTCEECWNRKYEPKAKFIVLRTDNYNHTKTATIHDRLDIAKLSLEAEWQDCYNDFLANRNVSVHEEDTFHENGYAVVSYDEYKVEFELITTYNYV